MTVLGAIFPPNMLPERLRPVALGADRAGLEQLWLWEDCFAESGIAPAAAVLAWTQQLSVGIGLLPVPLRNAALTAMELATLERLFPGRLAPGVGHGVLEWMSQVGARAASPMTLLDEYASALHALLHGQRVTTTGRYVNLDDVALRWAPSAAPPLLVGAVGDKTVRLAAERGDGVVLTGETPPARVREIADQLRAARGTHDPGGSATIVAFVPIDAALPASDAAQRVNEYAAAGATHVAVLAVGAAGPPLEEYVGFLATQVRPLVRGD